MNMLKLVLSCSIIMLTSGNICDLSIYNSCLKSCHILPRITIYEELSRIWNMQNRPLSLRRDCELICESHEYTRCLGFISDATKNYNCIPYLNTCCIY